MYLGAIYKNFALVAPVTVENLIDAIVAGQTYAKRFNGKVIKERVMIYPTADKLWQLRLQATYALNNCGKLFMKLEDTFKSESKIKSAAPQGQKTSKNTESACTFTVTGAPKRPNKRHLGQGQEDYFGV